MRSDYIARTEYQHILASLMPPNRLVLEVSMSTGLRLSDVLNMRTDHIDERMTVRQLKTGKSRRVYIPHELCDRMRSHAGKIYVFEGRLDYRHHRTRQAVYKDIKRSCKLYRLPPKLQISPHTARKVYAVSIYQRSGSLKRVQDLLSHDNEAVTMIYAMADMLTARKLGQPLGSVGDPSPDRGF